jgi:hypothetical protein
MNHNLHDGPQPSGPRPDLEQPTTASTSQARPSAHQEQAYSPPPSMESPQAAIAASKMPRRLVGVAVLVAAGLLAGAWYGFSGGGGSPTSPAVAAVDKQQKTFAVAAVDADLKATEQLKHMLSGGGAAAADADDLQAINTSALKSLAKSTPKTAEEIKSGRRVLYRIYLLDFLAEDGDHVEFSVDGLSFGDTLLKGAGTSILIPLAPGTPAQLKVLATVDGGGGVTVGFLSSLGEARTRIMQVGEFDEWQVIVQ